MAELSTTTDDENKDNDNWRVDLIPKKETQVLDFLKRHPEYDGRNVRIGILDTGVYPGAHSIHTMMAADNGSGGGGAGGGGVITPKLVDLVDCTGAGDVDVSTEVDAVWTVPAFDDKGGSNASQEPYWQVTGLTGRTLKLSSAWKLEAYPVPLLRKEEEQPSKEKGKGDNSKDSKGQDSKGQDSKAGGDEKEEKKPGKEESSSPTKDEEEKKEKVKTATVRLGVKRAYDLFPERLVGRVRTERTKIFRRQVDGYVAALHAELAVVRARFGPGGGGGGDTNSSGGNSNGKPPTPEQARERDDLEARLEVLNDASWTDDDPGPVYDCVVFYDGTDYRAVVDVDEGGDLVDASPMTAFAKERQYGTFGTLDRMNYAVNFYRDGAVLSLVCDSSPHGTHVAGIAASAAPAEGGNSHSNDRSGVAPGAELVGLVIGDVRLGTMETGAALARAMGEAVRLKCDVVNLSFGEGSCASNAGRFVELAEDLVWKHNVTFVASAGNDGPALTTVKAPGGTSSAIIGVAAYVSPDMMKAEYSMPLTESTSPDGSTVMERKDETFAGTTYTWSSVGPADDGDFGVNITAPGGAITSVPHWCLQKCRLMNGTSMSSPNVTGCLALLVSACKAEGIPISPTRIRRAIENTAKELPGLAQYQQGWGMIQVDDAYEYLKRFKDVDTDDIHFHVSVDNRPGNPRGIYLRQLEESSTRRMFSISVDPRFRREEVVSDEAQQRKIDFEMSFSIEANAPWVTPPSKFHLMNGGRSFKIEVDPTGLPAGVHTARVCGFDADLPDRKAIFTVPITVVKPLPPQMEFTVSELELQPAEVKRYFLTPPPGSTWMEVTIRDLRDAATDGDSSTRIVVLHTTQLMAHAAQRDFECQKYVTLLPGLTSVSTISVEEGVTIEIDIARLWSTIGTTKVDVSVEFRGVKPVPSSLHMVSGAGGSLVRLYSDLKDDYVNPAAKLTKWRAPLRPKGTPTVTPLTDRDVMPPYKAKVYQLVLIYEFTQDDPGAFTIRCPTLDGVLYESSFENHIMLVFDGEKKYLGASSNFPTPVTAQKGTVVIRMQVRHKDPKKLEELKQLDIWIERKLEKDIALAASSCREALMYSNGKFKKRMLRKGSSTSVFISGPPSSKIPSSCKNGDLLLGSVTYANGDTNLPGDGKRPGGFPISYSVGAKPPKSNSDPETPEAKDERTPEQKLEEAVRDLKVSQLDQFTKEELKDGKFEELYSKLEAEYPDHLPLLMTKLKYLDTHEKRDDSLPEIVAAADAVLSKLPEDEIALHFGRKSDSEDPEAVKERNKMKEKKGFLIEAMARKALAYGDSKSGEDAPEQFQQALKSLKEWVDIDGSDKYSALVILRDERAGRYGMVLKLLNKLLTKDVKDAIKPLSKSALLEKRQEILAKLGYDALVDYDKRTRIISCPKSYMLF